MWRSARWVLVFAVCALTIFQYTVYRGPFNALPQPPSAPSAPSAPAAVSAPPVRVVDPAAKRTAYSGARVGDHPTRTFVPLQRAHRDRAAPSCARWVIIPLLVSDYPLLLRHSDDGGRDQGDFGLGATHGTGDGGRRLDLGAATRAAIRSSGLRRLKNWCVLVVLDDGIDDIKPTEDGTTTAAASESEPRAGTRDAEDADSGPPPPRPPFVIKYLGAQEQQDLASHSETVRLILSRRRRRDQQRSAASPTLDLRAYRQGSLRNIGYAYALIELGATTIFDLADLTHRVAQRTRHGGEGAMGSDTILSLAETVISDQHPEMPHPDLHNMLLFQQRQEQGQGHVQQGGAPFLFNPWDAMLRFDDNALHVQAPIRRLLRPRGFPLDLGSTSAGEDGGIRTGGGGSTRSVPAAYQLISAPTGEPWDDSLTSPEADGHALCAAYTPNHHKSDDQRCAKAYGEYEGKGTMSLVQDANNSSRWFYKNKRDGFRVNDSFVVDTFHEARQRRRRFSRYDGGRFKPSTGGGRGAAPVETSMDTDTCALRSTKVG